MKNNALKFLDQNLSKILMITGVAGIFVTTYFAVEETFKTVDAIQEAKRVKEEETGSSKLEPKEVVQICTRNYIKTGISLVSTVAATTCAYSDEARQATLATLAYRSALDAITDKDRFNAKLAEAVGPKKTRQIEEEYANERAREVRTDGVIEQSKKCDGEKIFLFKDVIQGREFYSTGNAVREAFLRFKQEALDDVASDGFFVMDPEKMNYTKPLNDLNAELGISFTELGHTIAFTYQQITNLRPRIGSDLDSNGEPCFSLWYDVPIGIA